MVTEKNFKELENSQASLTLTVDAASIEKAYQERLQKYARTIEIPGFRKGKVPASVIERKFGQGIREESTFDIMEENLKATIETLEDSEKPLPYFVPELQDEETLLPFKKDSDITFTVKYDIYPRFELPAYTGLEVACRTAEVTEEDVDGRIKELQDQNAMVVKKNGAAAEGDIATIDYSEIDAEGNTVEGTERTGFVFTIGKGYNFYKLDSDIIGMSRGEEKTVTKTYTEEDGVEGYAGKTVTIKVALTELKYRDIPEVDDDFAQDVKEEYKTVADLRAGIRAEAEKELESRLKDEKYNALLSEIAKNVEIAIPESMLQQDLDNSWSRFVSQSGLSEEMVLKFMEQQNSSKEEVMEGWKEPARASLKKELIIEAIAKKENFPVDESEVDKKLEEEATPNMDEATRAYFRSYIENDMRMEKVAEYLIGNNTFTEKEKVSWKEFTSNVEE